MDGFRWLPKALKAKKTLQNPEKLLNRSRLAKVLDVIGDPAAGFADKLRIVDHGFEFFQVKITRTTRHRAHFIGMTAALAPICTTHIQSPVLRVFANYHAAATLP